MIAGSDMNEAVLHVMGWFFVILVTGAYVIYHYTRIRNANEAEFERQWQQKFEPNLPNVPLYPPHNEEFHYVDSEFLRLMETLPNDHLPEDWRDWGDKAGQRNVRG